MRGEDESVRKKVGLGVSARWVVWNVWVIKGSGNYGFGEREAGVVKLYSDHR